MLSRLALRSMRAPWATTGATSQLARMASDTPCPIRTDKYGYYPSWEAEERDHKNYPLPERPMEPGKVRMGMIPEEFFQAFYNKTGVTGPYCLIGGAALYALSKEVIPMEHQIINATSLAFLIYVIYKTQGEKIQKKTAEMSLESMKQWDLMREHAKHHLQVEIEKDSELAWQMEGIAAQLGPALKENILLQLEKNYRDRLTIVHGEVKRRLDFAVATYSTERRIIQEHMVDWVVRNVLDSISPEQEEENINACIERLRTIADEHQRSLAA